MSGPVTIEARLGDASGGGESELAHLRERLAADAGRAGLVEVAYHTVDSPIGVLLLAATPAGLARVGFESENHERILETLAGAIGPRVLHDPERLNAAARQLREYFTGRRRRFELPLDLRLVSGFRRSVIEQLPALAYGATASYAQLAAMAGRPRAIRAAGTACGRNPLPIVVPCHRVIRSDGTLGGYGGGLAVKRALLDLERAPLA